MQSYIHLKLCVQFDEGLALAETYKVGSTFPLYIIANSKGEVITRWSGFGGAQQFVSSLKTALRDLTSVNERLDKFEAKPNFRDALTLAKFYSDTRDNINAITYYRLAEKHSRNGTADYSYQIFTNTANLVWSDTWPFDSAAVAADYVLTHKRNKKNIANCVTILIRVARRAGQTDRLTPYFYAALEATVGSSDDKLQSKHRDLSIDSILYISKDETATLRAKEATLGDNWQNDPQEFYPYAKWCLEREINLPKAEQFARTAADRVNSGAFKAQVLHTLASILDVRGKHAEAVKFMEMSTQEDPANPWFSTEYDRMLENWSKAESKKQ